MSIQHVQLLEDFDPTTTLSTLRTARRDRESASNTATTGTPPNTTILMKQCLTEYRQGVESLVLWISSQLVDPRVKDGQTQAIKEGLGAEFNASLAKHLENGMTIATSEPIKTPDLRPDWGRTILREYLHNVALIEARRALVLIDPARGDHKDRKKLSKGVTSEVDYEKIVRTIESSSQDLLEQAQRFILNHPEKLKGLVSGSLKDLENLVEIKDYKISLSVLSKSKIASDIHQASHGKIDMVKDRDVFRFMVDKEFETVFLQMEVPLTATLLRCRRRVLDSIIEANKDTATNDKHSGTSMRAGRR